MSDREAHELAALRQELRDRLMALDRDGAITALVRLRDVAGSDLELRAEYERWSFRFELLGV